MQRSVRLHVAAGERERRERLRARLQREVDVLRADDELQAEATPEVYAVADMRELREERELVHHEVDVSLRP